MSPAWPGPADSPVPAQTRRSPIRAARASLNWRYAFKGQPGGCPLHVGLCSEP